MSFVLRLFLLVPITCLIMIAYAAPGETEARGLLRAAGRKTAKVVFWVVVIIVVMELLQLLFLP